MSDEAVARLQAIIRIPTVSYDDPSRIDTEAFDSLLTTMSTNWPRVHALDVIRVGRHGLLIHWPGATDERPLVLMAHLDVVPVVADDWSRDPFSAEIVDGTVWGRGTLDDKGCVAAICEAVEALLADGFVPAHDIWLSFGCDEEVSGESAKVAAGILAARGVRPWMVVDEGGAVAAGAFPGIKDPIAVIGVTEKGVTSLLLRADGDGGHASTPARNAPTVRIARALVRLDKNQMSARLPAPTLELFRRLAPHARKPLGSLLANAERLGPAASRALVAAGAETAAMVRTTFAATTLSGSPALNVIAAEATAGINIRVMVGDTVADAITHVRKVIKDSSINIETVEANEPSPVSPYSTAEQTDPGFDLMEAVIAEVFPDAICTPYVMMAATDSRHFTAIADRVYRFAPFRMSKQQRATIHAADEHIGINDFLAGITWYRRLIEEHA